MNFRRFVYPFLILSAFILLVLLPLFQKGTFIDGVLYKTVAFNDAHNSGQFWTMKYTDTCMPVFCEQPPLYPWLLGRFYAFFGDSYLVDRFFTLLLLVALGLVLWKSMKTERAGVFSTWLLFFFLLAVPVFCWSYVNQVIEPLVCVLVAAGILFFILYRKRGGWWYIALFALSLYLSFLAKGFQSCFLIVLPLVVTLRERLEKRSVTLLIAAGFLLSLLLFVTLRLWQPAVAWLDCYVDARLVLTMQNVGSTTDNHFEIIGRFFSELIGPLICLAFLLLWLKFKKRYALRFVFANFMRHRLALPLLITSLAGSFPFALSLVQRGFYLVPAFICFLLALTLGFRRYWIVFFTHLSASLAGRVMRWVLPFVFAATVICFFLNVGGYKREEELLGDLKLIEAYLPENDTLSIEDEMWNYFNLHSYLYMDKRCSLIKLSDKKQPILITKREHGPLPPEYQCLMLPTRELQLWVLPADGAYLSRR